jgi:hypothetical protein
MPNMSVSKKARYVASITNRTTIFGIMGGLSNSVGVLAANQSAIRNKASNQQSIPLDPVAGLSYMKGNNPMGRIMLSRNPQCSGGVGRTSGGGFAGCGAVSHVSNSLLLNVAPIYGSWVITITGGTESTNGLYTYHTFDADGTLTMTATVVGGDPPTTPATKKIEHLVVSGGGSGGGVDTTTGSFGGGGGGGGVVVTTTDKMTTYNT